MRKTVHQAEELTTTRRCDRSSAAVWGCIINEHGGSCKLPCHGQGSGNSYFGGGESTATLQAVSGNGRPCLEPIESLECAPESMLTEARVRGKVTERGRGQYEIRPVTKGRNLLHIRVG